MRHSASMSLMVKQGEIAIYWFDTTGCPWMSFVVNRCHEYRQWGSVLFLLMTMLRLHTGIINRYHVFNILGKYFVSNLCGLTSLIFESTFVLCITPPDYTSILEMVIQAQKQHKFISRGPIAQWIFRIKNLSTFTTFKISYPHCHQI